MYLKYMVNGSCTDSKSSACAHFKDILSIDFKLLYICMSLCEFADRPSVFRLFVFAVYTAGFRITIQSNALYEISDAFDL